MTTELKVETMAMINVMDCHDPSVKVNVHNGVFFLSDSSTY